MLARCQPLGQVQQDLGKLFSKAGLQAADEGISAGLLMGFSQVVFSNLVTRVVHNLLLWGWNAS